MYMIEATFKGVLAPLGTRYFCNDGLFHTADDGEPLLFDMEQAIAIVSAFSQEHMELHPILYKGDEYVGE